MKLLILLLLFVPSVARCEDSSTPISLTDAEEIEAGEAVARDFIQREVNNTQPRKSTLISRPWETG